MEEVEAALEHHLGTAPTRGFYSFLLSSILHWEKLPKLATLPASITISISKNRSFN
jgi:hypothetical protein